MSLAYYRVSYGGELTSPFPSASSSESLLDHLGGHCSVLLINIGQWWASWKPKPKPPHAAKAPQEYADLVVKQQMERLGALSRGPAHPLPVAWVATNPFPFNVGGPTFSKGRAKSYDMSTCPTAERRFPHVLAAYNDVARRAAAEHGLDFVDNWEIALPLLELSEDTAHYSFDGSPIGRPQAARALEWALGVLQPRAACLATRGRIE